MGFPWNPYEIPMKSPLKSPPKECFPTPPPLGKGGDPTRRGALVGQEEVGTVPKHRLRMGCKSWKMELIGFCLYNIHTHTDIDIYGIYIYIYDIYMIYIYDIYIWYIYIWYIYMIYIYMIYIYIWYIYMIWYDMIWYDMIYIYTYRIWDIIHTCMRACIHMTLDDFMDSFSKDFYQFSGLLWRKSKNIRKSGWGLNSAGLIVVFGMGSYPKNLICPENLLFTA